VGDDLRPGAANGAEALVRQRFAESAEVARSLQHPELVAFTDRAAGIVARALGEGGKVLFCGNGGSAADATHLAAELVGRFTLERDALAALSLTDNPSAMSSIANDYDYAQTFARQVRAHGRPGDVLIAMSTSGRSANVIEAVAAAREIGLATVGMTGTPGGRLPDACDLCLRVPSGSTARVQEGTMVVGHTICELVERALFA